MLSTNLRFIFIQLHTLARMFHEWPIATVDMAVLPGVLACPANVSVIGTTFRTRQCFVPFRVVYYIPRIP
jgi:hypothetical protein